MSHLPLDKGVKFTIFSNYNFFNEHIEIMSQNLVHFHYKPLTCKSYTSTYEYMIMYHMYIHYVGTYLQFQF
jgi:hypothetical protein